jgi:hypothetical protein
LKTPKVFNIDNPEQAAEGSAARGKGIAALGLGWYCSKEKSYNVK